MILRTALYLLFLFGLHLEASPITIDSGHPILDDNGNFLHAHGGGVIRVGDYFYWFGENRNFNSDDSFHAVSCYRSTNLRDWEFRNHVLRSSDDPDLQYAKIERPKVIYNPATRRFVMWMHKEWGSHYGEARAAVASCDTVDGQYTYHGSFRPEGTHMSRDCTLFVDDDGKAYFLSAAKNNADLNLYLLRNDFLGTNGLIKVISPGASRESPCLFKRNGRYFIIGSGTTGWSPNQAKYATSTSLTGTWSTPANFGNGTTYGSQSAYVLTIQGTEATDYLYIGDRWARAWGDYTGYSQYVFLPLHFPTDSVITMEDAEHITVDPDTGYLACGYLGWDKVDDRSYRVSYSSGWGTYYGNSGYAKSEHFSEVTGSEAAFTFYGDRVQVFGARRNDLGILKVTIDGIDVANVDCYRAAAQYGVMLYESPLLSRGTHTVTVRVTGTKNAASSGTEIVLDAFTSRDSAGLVSQPSGEYRLVNAQSGKDITVTTGSSGATQFPWNEVASQRWLFLPQADGTHFIGNPASNLWLDVAGQSTANDALLQLKPATNSAFQRWQVQRTPGGAFTLLNSGSQRVADVQAASRADNAPAIQYSSNGGQNQRWHLVAPRNPLFNTHQIIEAETASSQPRFAPFVADSNGSEPAASSIRVPKSTGWQVGTPANGICQYSFTTTATSTRVRYWLLANGPDADSDTLNVREDGGAWSVMRLQQHPSDFLWNYWKESRLGPGVHTLSLGWAYDGLRIDKIMIQVLSEDPAITDCIASNSGSQREMQLKWSSASGFTYAIESSENLAAGTWQTIASGIPATPPQNTWQSTPLTATRGFFRVRREP